MKCENLLWTFWIVNAQPTESRLWQNQRSKKCPHLRPECVWLQTKKISGGGHCCFCSMIFQVVGFFCYVGSCIYTSVEVWCRGLLVGLKSGAVNVKSIYLEKNSKTAFYLPNECDYISILIIKLQLCIYDELYNFSILDKSQGKNQETLFQFWIKIKWRIKKRLFKQT